MIAQDEQTRQLINRLKTVAGHVRGVQRMVETDAYCIDIIKQTQAVQRALSKFNGLMLTEYLNDEVTTVLKDAPQTERERVVNELLNVFKGGQSNMSELPASPDVAERIPQRMDWLAQIEERVRAVQHLLETDAYPVAIMQQTREVQHMLDAFQSRVLADHLNGCVTTAIRSQQPAERERVVNELLQVFTTSNTL
jgi:DNA-binding FrmR family transcriptional regulator